MKKLLFLAILFGILVTPAWARGSQEESSDSLKVITTIFPLYDFSREVGGELADVSLILPPGVEAHSYEPTPRDIIRINQADIFIYAGEAMEPWAQRVIQSLTSKNIIIIDASSELDLIEGHHHHDDDHHHDDYHDDEHHDDLDPHFWTDPLRVKTLIDEIAKAFIQADEENSAYYLENARLYKEQLDELHEKISTTVETLRIRTILYGGHFAFGYFSQRYGFDHISPYTGFSPSAEPTAQKIVELIETMRALGLEVIYHEELIDPRVARVIAEETGAELLLLHGIHNVTKDELARGVTYISLMEENLRMLVKGLGTR